MSMLKAIAVLLLGAASIAAASKADAADKVTIGVTNSSSDIALFIADAKGYYKDAGIEVAFNSFDSAAKMIGNCAQ